MSEPVIITEITIEPPPGYRMKQGVWRDGKPEIAFEQIIMAENKRRTAGSDAVAARVRYESAYIVLAGTECAPELTVDDFDLNDGTPKASAPTVSVQWGRREVDVFFGADGQDRATKRAQELAAGENGVRFVALPIGAPIGFSALSPATLPAFNAIV